MSGIAQYIFSIAGAAIVLAVLRPLLEGKGAVTAIGKLVAGIFLLLTVLQPIVKASIGNLEDLTDLFQADASDVIAAGQDAAKRELESIISEQVRTYILDKAAQYNAELTVEVTLSDDEIPVPVHVTIHGSISPYGKRQMQAMIACDLGISKEDQTWK